MISPPVDPDKVSTAMNTGGIGRRVGQFLVALLLVSLFVSGPAAAQTGATNPVCQDSSNTLVNMIEGFIKVTVAVGLMGLLVVWQADALTSMFTLNSEQKASLKEHRRSAMHSAVILVVLGPLFAVTGSAMGLPIAQCVNLTPF